MLKTYPTSFLLPKRLKLASPFRRRDRDRDSHSPTVDRPLDRLDTTLPPARSAGLTTDAATVAASLPAHQNLRPQPILLVSHQAMAQPSTDTRSPTRRTVAATYFPLGYKEAAQQWVGCPIYTLTNRPLTLTLTVDKRVRAPG